MKIVYMGTPDFSVPTLVKLYNDKDIEIAYVVTKCDSKSKRGLALNFSAVKTKALELGIDILQPIKIKDDRSVIENQEKLQSMDMHHFYQSIVELHLYRQPY